MSALRRRYRLWGWQKLGYAERTRIVQREVAAGRECVRQAALASRREAGHEIGSCRCRDCFIARQRLRRWEETPADPSLDLYVNGATA